MNIEYKLSILLVTYNHESNICAALDGLFSQIFEGQIELVVADDSSTDNTLSIIKEYENRDGRFMFTYLNTDKNVGVTKNYQRGFAACTGEYIAVLEGDDYWISPLKLQKQIEFLDIHRECNLCSVNYFVFQETIAHFYPRIAISNTYRLISARELIADNIVGNFSTCMYRKAAIDALPQALYETTSYDWIINISVAKNSFIGFLETPMSVYRLHASGIWSQKTTAEKLQQQLDLIPIYNTLTDKIFNEEFNNLAIHLTQMISGVAVKNALRSFIKRMPINVVQVKNYLPPIVIILLNLLLPPKIKDILKKY